MNRKLLSEVRPGLAYDDLQAVLGDKWRPLARKSQGWFFGREIGEHFSVRVTRDGRIGYVSFDGRFPAKYAFEGVLLGMHQEEALAARPALRASLEDEEGAATETLASGHVMTVQFARGKVGGVSFQDPAAVFQEERVWEPAVPSRYPAPEGAPGAPFADPNLKLVVLEALLDDGAIDLGKPEELAEHLLGRLVDLEEEGYEAIPEVRDYLDRYPLTTELLSRVTWIGWDASSQIYRFISYFWDGGSREFDVASLAGLEHLERLERAGFPESTCAANEAQIAALIARGVKVDRLT